MSDIKNSCRFEQAGTSAGLVPIISNLISSLTLLDPPGSRVKTSLAGEEKSRQ